MKSRFTATFGSICLIASASAFAQTNTGQSDPGAQSTNPSAASSPSQRETTKSPANEASPVSGTNPSDASTPHQNQVTKKKHKSKTTSSSPNS